MMEDLVRAELTQLAGQVTPGRLRPLRPPGRSGRLARLLSPAVAGASLAAVAVVAVTVSLLALRPSPGPASPAGPRPAFYVTAQQYAGASMRIEVHDSATGRVSGTTTSPLPDGEVTTLAAAPDDRTFYLVISGMLTQQGTQTVTYRLYRMRVSAAGRPGPVEAMPERLSGWNPVGLAVSPDGDQLAITSGFVGDTNPPTVISSFETINLVTGRVRFWTVPAGNPLGPPTWQAGSRFVALPWQHLSASDAVAQSGIRLLDTSAPATTLNSAQLIAVSTGSPAAAEVVTADVRSLIELTCTRAPAGAMQRGVFTAQLLDVPVGGGQPRVLYAKSERYDDSSQYDGLFGSCRLLAADTSGRHLLTDVLGFGRFENGTFTPLPAGIATSPDDAPPAAAAW